MVKYLLTTRTMDGSTRMPQLRRGKGTCLTMGIYGNYTAGARAVLAHAQTIARSLQHAHVDTPHLLLALAEERNDAVERLLHEFGLKPLHLRETIHSVLAADGLPPPPDELEMTGPAQRVLEVALGEARSSDAHAVDTPHLLLGLARTEGGVLPTVIERMGLSQEDLLARSGRALRSQGTTPAPPSVVPRPVRTPVLMVVDDNPETLRMYQELLRDAGYRVAPSTLPRLARSIGEFEQPDLVILDWVFGQEGRSIQALQQLKLWPTTAGLPMLVCALLAPNLENLAPSLRAQGVSLVAKPCVREDLLAAIATQLHEATRNNTAPPK